METILFKGQDLGFRYDPEKHLYTRKDVKVPGVTSILKELGFIDFSFVKKEIMERAQTLGTAVHKTCELYDNHDLPEKLESAEILNPYLESWKKFQKDFKFKIIYNEKMVASAKWNFCGTLDRFGTGVIKGKSKQILLDIKTSKCYYPAVELQLAGYEIALREMEDMKGEIIRMSVQLSPDNYKITISEDYDMNVFLSAVNCYNWKKNKLKIRG
jgi:hypothetical protein